MQADKVNSVTANKLREGTTCIVQGFGNSMLPLIHSGQIVEVVPVQESDNLSLGDIVLCKVKGRYFLHLVSAIRDKQYQISNNHKFVNGWITKNSIYGKVTKVIS